MSQVLLLDAAFPPDDPQQWIQVMQTAGAQGCLAYIWDEQVVPDKWRNPGYIQAIRNDGYLVLPTYVWGPNYPAIGHAPQILKNYGFTSGPCMGDIELGSTPSESYYQSWCQNLRDNDYVAVSYGTASTLDVYRRYGDKGYLASYIQRQLFPVPDLVGISYDGWQYANSFYINGTEVDASVTSIQLQGDIDLTSAQDEALLRILNMLSTGENTPVGGATSGDPSYLKNMNGGLQNSSTNIYSLLSVVKTEVDTVKTLIGGEPVATRILNALKAVGVSLDNV